MVMACWIIVNAGWTDKNKFETESHISEVAKHEHRVKALTDQAEDSENRSRKDIIESSDFKKVLKVNGQ